MWLRCFPRTLAYVAPAQARPSPFQRLHLFKEENPELSMHGILARYINSVSMGTCECAETWVDFMPAPDARPTLPAPDPNEWTRSDTGGCADMPSTQCIPADLQPD